MGRPSDKRRSARRPGQAERARRKNRHRRSLIYCEALRDCVTGAGTSQFLKTGRKKGKEVARFLNAHPDGEPHPESRADGADGRSTRAAVRSCSSSGFDTEVR